MTNWPMEASRADATVGRAIAVAECSPPAGQSLFPPLASNRRKQPHRRLQVPSDLLTQDVGLRQAVSVFQARVLQPEDVDCASRSGRLTDSLFTQGFIELSWAEQHVSDAALNGFRAQCLRTHHGVGLEGADDGVHEFGLKIRRVGELLFRVIGRLLLERLGLEELPHDHVVDVNQFVLVREVTFEQVVHTLDDLEQSGFLLLLNATAARFGDRW